MLFNELRQEESAVGAPRPSCGDIQRWERSPHRLTATLLTAILLSVCGRLGVWALDDPLERYLISPAMVMEKADAIGLTEEQRMALQKVGQESHEKAMALTPTLDEARRVLGESIQKDMIDEAEAVGRLATMLDAERVMKRLHLETLVRVHNILTPAQRVAMRAFNTKAKDLAAEMAEKEARLKAKMERVKQGVDTKLQAGEQPLEVVELMQGFHPLMQEGKHVEAERILDRALEMLGAGESEPSTPDASSVSPPASPGSIEELKAEIAGMRVADVAWRQIGWKTCLIDGLKASREQEKPVLLWVFIDRPVDDKRC